jgi:hypothetical protein
MCVWCPVPYVSDPRPDRTTSMHRKGLQNENFLRFSRDGTALVDIYVGTFVFLGPRRHESCDTEVRGGWGTQTFGMLLTNWLCSHPSWQTHNFGIKIQFDT